MWHMVGRVMRTPPPLYGGKDWTFPERGYLPRLHTHENLFSASVQVSICSLEQQGDRPVLTPAFSHIQVNYTEVAGTCNLWRNYKDIQDSWKSVLSILDWFVKHQDILQPVSGPGHWNDPDMVPVWKGEEVSSPIVHSVPAALTTDTLCFSFF